jgi:hypothetical protein
MPPRLPMRWLLLPLAGLAAFFCGCAQDGVIPRPDLDFAAPPPPPPRHVDNDIEVWVRQVVESVKDSVDQAPWKPDGSVGESDSSGGPRIIIQPGEDAGPQRDP